MGFPRDLSDVRFLKIHPAIGVARVANSETYYVFGANPESYKADGLMKRQAVQFRIFAYGQNHVGLGELTGEVRDALGLTVVWSARVANRKIAKLLGTPLDGADHVIAAEASSNDDRGGTLTGGLRDFQEGIIPLGQITAEGLFIPPRGGLYRKTASAVPEDYPAKSTDVADTTCDGEISVLLIGADVALDVVPACIIVAPQDFSPDTDESYSIAQQVRDDLGMANPVRRPVGTIHNRTANALDYEAIKSTTSDYQPGFEACLGGNRTEVADLRSIFFAANEDPRIAPHEVRVRYRERGGDRGAVPGQLTSGLCSTWQGDFTACVGHWAEHLPLSVFLDEDPAREVDLFRKTYANPVGHPGRRWDAEDFAKGVDRVGVARLRDGAYVETEREPGEDIE